MVHRGHMSHMNVMSCNRVPMPDPVQRLVQTDGGGVPPPFLVLMPVQMLSHSVHRMRVRSDGSLLLDGLGGVMVSRRRSLLVDGPGGMLVDGLPCMAVRGLPNVTLGRLCHVVMAGRLRRHQLVLLPLRSVNNVDRGRVLMPRSCLTGRSAAASATHSRNHAALSCQLSRKVNGVNRLVVREKQQGR